MKKIGILGSTGSIGKNTLDILSRRSDLFSVSYLSANRNAELLLEQARIFKPARAALMNEKVGAEYRLRFREVGVELLSGFEGILALSGEDVDLMVNALVGAIGLRPTLNALKPGKRVALANKETLVLGGKLVTEKAREMNAELIPIDSEHSAILQCIVGERKEDIKKLILTASGGPFRQWSTEKLKNVSIKDALNHPNWDMGSKITIDSATMMNKGLEVIEAFWLFDLDADRIEVLIHPESIIHSLVEFVDCSCKAQLGLPDMRAPIQYALTFPERIQLEIPELNLASLGKLTFEEPDVKKFRCLKLAFDALRQGGTAPGVLNASNEEAVNLFLNEKIHFNQIPYLVEDALEHCGTNSYHGVEDLLNFDEMARNRVREKYEQSF